MSPTQLGSTTPFIGSFSFDIRLALYDIMGSMAHATMLGKKKIISAAETRQIIKGLTSIQKDLNRNWVLPYDEDIHFALERELIKRVGHAGRKLHTGRSRNDQVITDLFLYMKDQIGSITKEISHVQKAILHVAQKYQNVVMPGYTHLQHAQPILFSHHILAYAWMLERDKGRLLDLFKRVDILPLGSAALAGTSFPIDRNMVARILKFKAISENSLDATSSRDVVAEFLAANSIMMSNLSRVSEELIIWASSEFSFVELGDEFTSGSSIMPQKKNPDVAEIIRGQTGRVYGSLINILTILKGIPLAYNRDLQEDKPPLFDSVDTVLGCLSIMARMIQTLKVDEAQMRHQCDQGFLEATELADFLAQQGVPFRLAHGTVRKIVLYCQKQKIRFRDLSLDTLKKFHKKFSPQVLKVLTPDAAVRAKQSYGGTSPQSVKNQISKLNRLIK